MNKKTKRSMKAQRGPNNAITHSLKNGSRHVVNGDVYMGKNPTYQPIIDPLTKMISGYRKVSRGVPFVRA